MIEMWNTSTPIVLKTFSYHLSNNWALERKSKHSVPHKHIIAEHGDEEKDVKFERRVTGRYRDCLNRQISEALAIRNAPQGSLLNSNPEFYQPCIKKKSYVD